MPPQRRHLLLVLFCVLTVLVCLGAPGPAAAQGKNGADTAKTPKPSAPEPAVPSAESIVIMIRTALLNLDAAMATGNYTVFRDLAAPSLREANSAGRLYQIFSDLSAQRISLSAVAILVPKLPEPPAIDANKRLRISGHFPGDPVQINFDLRFEAVAGQWRLFGIAVNPAKSASNAAGRGDAAGSTSKPKAPSKIGK
jgi:hypothetical protein